jgi:hypothetical protein
MTCVEECERCLKSLVPGFPPVSRTALFALVTVCLWGFCAGYFTGWLELALSLRRSAGYLSECCPAETAHMDSQNVEVAWHLSSCWWWKVAIKFGFPASVKVALQLDADWAVLKDATCRCDCKIRSPWHNHGMQHSQLFMLPISSHTGEWLGQTPRCKADFLKIS